MLRLVLLGPPGSGKGTQAVRVAAACSAEHIATGDLLRAEVAAGSELGERVAGYQASGSLVPDDLILRLALPRVLAASEGYVLDGFPRSLPQARALDEQLPRGQRVHQAVVIAVAEQELIDRMRLRAAQQHRPDDTDEVFRHRLSIYAAETPPILQHYADSSRLREVDGSGSPDEVFQRIGAVLEV